MEANAMGQIFNVYCDESCHLQYDNSDVMVLGSIWCPLDKTREISEQIRSIIAKHKLLDDFEIKWNKVSPAKEQFYLDLMDYFFDNDDLHFRALVALRKLKLQHAKYNQTHDEWYYKMYFTMLKVILDPKCRYRIYLDIKDTKGGKKVQKLHEVLSNSIYDFSQEIIERLQVVRSHEVVILQLADLLIGTVAYANRGLTGNTAKESLVLRMRKRSGYGLIRQTLYKEDKVNIFLWQPTEVDE
jgi:hypothetical protein